MGKKLPSSAHPQRSEMSELIERLPELKVSELQQVARVLSIQNRSMMRRDSLLESVQKEARRCLSQGTFVDTLERFNRTVKSFII